MHYLTFIGAKPCTFLSFNRSGDNYHSSLLKEKIPCHGNAVTGTDKHHHQTGKDTR